MGQFTYPDGKENHSLSFFCNWTHYINLIETIGKTKHITKFSISWNFLKEYCVLMCTIGKIPQYVLIKQFC